MVGSSDVRPSIAPRALRTELPHEAPENWVDGDPFLTTFVSALSLTFPPGERFFTDAVRRVRSQLKDPALRAAVQGFLTQEALHSREHQRFNLWLSQHGVDALSIMRDIDAQIARRRATRGPVDDLAVVAALEHFTALLSDAWLADAELQERMPPTLRALWTWHAVEEIEHKSVAFDVYTAVGGDYRRRVRWMARITLGFVLGISVLQLRLLAQRGELRPSWSIASGLYRFWGPRGLMVRLVPQYLRYYLPSFHPSQHDQSSLYTHFEGLLREAGLTVPAVRAA
jgi:uncharacterized protein